MTTLFTDNFDTDTVGSIAPGFTAITGTWAVMANQAVDGANSLQNTSGANGDTVLCSTGLTDGTHTIEYKYATGMVYPGMICRSDASFANGYLFLPTTPTGGFVFYKRVSGAFQSQGPTGGAFSTPTPGDIVTQELRFIGSTIELRLWNVTQGGARPSSPTSTFTDSAATFTGAGRTGVYAGQAMAIDDYVVADNTSAGGGTATVSANFDNAGLLYSPINWSFGSGAARTINAGAYLRTMVSAGGSLNFDVSNAGSPKTKLAWRINGGAWNDFALAASVPFTIPAAYAAVPLNLLEMVVVSTSQNLTRWGSPSATMVVFTGITSTSSTFAVRAPVRRPGSYAFFGDSITEGVRTVGYQQSAANDNADNDVRLSWAWLVGEWLGGEFGIVGFGGQGWTKGGSGGVPALGDSFNLNYPGSARAWPSDLRAVFTNMGTNDGSAATSTVQPLVQTFITSLLAAVPAAASLVMMAPFQGFQAAAIQGAVAAIGAGRAFYEDTSNVFDPSLGSDDIHLHPNGPNNRGFVAPAAMNYLAKYAQPRRFTPVAG